MRAHVVERCQPLSRDGAGDLALADAVAAADLRLIRQGCNGRRRVQRFTSGKTRAEDQRLAHLGDIRALLQEIEEPGAIRRLAVHDGADQLVVLQYQPLVDAARRIAQHDLLAARSFREVAGREQVDAGDLEFRRDGARRELGGRVAGQLRRDDAGHFIERRDEAEDLARDLGALSDRENIGVTGMHGGVDLDAAPDVDPRCLGDARRSA